ncbi:MAG: type I 3-dehydroquinate dehydratase [Candidatus Firestonebacteria bacterium]
MKNRINFNKLNIIAVIAGNKPLLLSGQAKKNKADIIELRIDTFKNLNPDFLCKTIITIKRDTQLPIIGTFRSFIEGGKCPISEEKRLEIFKSIIPYVDVVDIELSADKIIDEVIEFARKQHKKIIISYHNFKKTPNERELNKILSLSIKKSPDITKIATFASTLDDVLRLFLFNHKFSHENRLITSMCMGKFAAVSRLLGPVFGSKLIYGYIGTAIVSGQLSVKSVFSLLNTIYRSNSRI